VSNPPLGFGAVSLRNKDLIPAFFATKAPSFLTAFCYVFIVRCNEPRTMNNEPSSESQILSCVFNGIGENGNAIGQP
jgi:hypothetical protein